MDVKRKAILEEATLDGLAVFAWTVISSVILYPLIVVFGFYGFFIGGAALGIVVALHSYERRKGWLRWMDE